MRRALSALSVAALLLLARPLRACLWDRDTLEEEAKGAIADVVSIIVGRFERNPPLYYAMRLKRSEARVRADPDDLDAYDDAGVACDRLGLGDESIAWMERKAARLDAMSPWSRMIHGYDDHRYRYLANVGTFWAHRWIRAGADRARIDEVRTARDFIAKAVALNPDAHFGREAYQLKALDWIINPVRHVQGPDRALSGFLDPADPSNATDATIRGLSGLIALGNGWESVDIFNTLAQALERDGERGSVAMLAVLRAQELIDAGRRSLDPAATTDPESLKRAVEDGLWTGMTMGPSDIARVTLRATYRRLRDEADAWHRARLAYMLPRLESGRHPDTDPDFWRDYHEAPGPTVPDVMASVEWSRRWRLVGLGSLAAAVVAASLASVVTIVRRIPRGRKPVARTAEL